MAKHSQLLAVSDSESAYFSKIGRTISEFINLLAIPIYAMLTHFVGKYYI